MADIIVRQANATSLTIQSSSNQVIVRQQPNNTVVVQTTGNSYVLPVATNSTLGGIIVGDNLTINANGMLSAQAGGVSTFNNRTGNVTLLANDVTSLANGVYLADRLSNISMSYGTDSVQGMNKTTAIVSFLSGLTGLNRGVTAVRSGNLVASVELNSDDLFGGVLIRHNNDSIFFNYDGLQSFTGTANYSWSADSFITQGRGDSRYATPANLTVYQLTATNTWANLSGAPNISLYLTTANAASQYLADTLSNISMSYGTDFVRGMTKTTACISYLSGLTGLNRGVTAVRSGNLIASVELNSDDLFGGVLIRHNNDSIFYSYEGLQSLTGTANYAWSSDHFITQGRGDGRYVTPANLTAYLPSANFTYSNISGTPPIATNTTLGAIKVGTTLEIANGVLDVTVLTIDGGSATASGPNIYDGGGA
jgi:hypothetical protein